MKAAYYGVIKESKDMNPNCRGYALPSLCYSVLPICRTPEETNHQFFRNKAIAMEELRQRYSEQTTTTSTTMSPTTSTAIEPSTTIEAIVLSTTSITTSPTQATNTGGTPTTFEDNRKQLDNIEKPKNKNHKHDKKNNMSRKVKGQKSPTTAHPILSSSSPPDSQWSDSKLLADLPTTAASDPVINMRKKRSFDVMIDAKTNFARNRHFEGYAQASTLTKLSSLAETEAFKLHYPPTRNTENLRRICRSECELLENELCQKEYAIAKRHPAIGQVLPLEDCYNLPEDTKDCSSLGIAIDVDENERCYWENGAGYRGTVAKSQSGKPCLTWARLMKEIADYPELAGQNYCR